MAEVFGHPVDPKDIAIRRRVGYMSQAFSLYGELTLRQNLELHGRLFGMPNAEIGPRLEELADRFGFVGTLEELPDALPLGMRQRLSLAVALIHRPDILILDEPTTALDVVVQREILQRINALREELGFSVILITHDMPLLLCWADTICVLQRGRVLDLGSPSALQSGDVHPYTQQLLDAFVEPDHKVPRVGGAS
jgi:ribosome-dependent ATPase